MQNKTKFSRRALLESLAVVSASPAAFSADGASSSDARLIALGREFDAVAAEVDRGIEGPADIPTAALDGLGEVLAEIEATPATTIEGLQVKARAACWSLLGDLDTPEKATGDVCMALSIFRDLIRMHRPEMERPGALTKLVEEIENGAG